MKMELNFKYKEEITIIALFAIAVTMLCFAVVEPNLLTRLATFVVYWFSAYFAIMKANAYRIAKGWTL